MHPTSVRRTALDQVAEGRSVSQVARVLGVPRTTVRDWARHPTRAPRAPGCPRCEGVPLDTEAYAEVLGWYLGDGCLAAAARGVWVLRISNDARWTRLNHDLPLLVGRVHPGGRVGQVAAPGCRVTTSTWKHWPCLFPQHGPGRKHLRAIALEPWQDDVVRAHPAAFLRGLLHSDGSRVRNWTTRPVAGVVRRYEYPRWQFSNRSEDVLALCTWALDLLGIAWRRSSRTDVSISRREAVASVDALVGPKS